MIVEAKASLARFPAHCADCDAAATRSYALPGAGDATLLVPLCERCHERKTLRQTLTVAGSFGLGVALTVLLGVLSEAVLDGETARRLAMPIALGLVTLPAIAIALGVRYVRRGFHRTRSGVWLEAFDASTGRVKLGVRRPEYARELSALNGGAPVGDYRAPTAPVQAARPMKSGLPVWALLPIGLGIIGVGFMRFSEMGEWEREGGELSTTMFEHTLYQIGGKGLVLGLFETLGIGLIVVTLLYWHRTRVAALKA